jgi:hypothetical protein
MGAPIGMRQRLSSAMTMGQRVKVREMDRAGGEGYKKLA